jgi:hypothetical protein
MAALKESCQTALPFDRKEPAAGPLKSGKAAGNKSFINEGNIQS